MSETSEDEATARAALEAFDQMIEGLARFAVAHDIDAISVERSIRRRFVAMAAEACKQDDRPATVARIQEMTKLPGFYIEEALNHFREPPPPAPAPHDDDVLEQLMAVVTKWTTDPEYTAWVGVPRTLNVFEADKNGARTFADLIHETLPKLSVEKALQTLQAAGVTQFEDDGRRVKIVSQFVSYKNQRARNIRRFGRTVAGLMSTLMTNATRTGGKTLLERTMVTDRPVLDSLFEEFQSVVSERADQVLGALDAEQRNFHAHTDETARTWGFCAFMFEVPNSETRGNEPTPIEIDVLATPRPVRRQR